VFVRPFLATGFILALLLTITAFAQESSRPHPDYVPDEKTAARIAEALFVGQYGEQRVKPQLPLIVAARGKDEWMIQGRVRDSKGRPQVGGGFGLLLNRHTGCILELVEDMN
jgi:hypothetical protein